MTTPEKADNLAGNALNMFHDAHDNLTEAADMLRQHAEGSRAIADEMIQQATTAEAKADKHDKVAAKIREFLD